MTTSAKRQYEDRRVKENRTWSSHKRKRSFGWLDCKEDRDWLKNQGSILIPLFRHYALPVMKSSLSSEGDGELGRRSMSKSEDVRISLAL